MEVSLVSLCSFGSGQYYMQFGVLHLNGDEDHLEILTKAMRMVKGIEKKIQYLYW